MTTSAIISLRLAKAGVEWLDKVAAEQRMNRSELIKAILRKAVRDYEKGWRP